MTTGRATTATSATTGRVTPSPGRLLGTTYSHTTGVVVVGVTISVLVVPVVPAIIFVPEEPATIFVPPPETLALPHKPLKRKTEIQSPTAIVWPTTLETVGAPMERNAPSCTNAHSVAVHTPFLCLASNADRPKSVRTQKLSALPRPSPPSPSSRTPLLPTPIRPDRLRFHLLRINYDRKLTNYLVAGFETGFPINHTNHAYDVQAGNAKQVHDLPDTVASKLDREMQAGRIAGPFPSPPFSPFQVSPLNLREKKSSDASVRSYRLLHNLSYPYDDKAVNANIPDSFKTVKYTTVGDAIRKLLELPYGAYSAKTDIADAYRLIPVSPLDYPKLGMQFKGQYFYDKCLPQGCSSSCRIFETFSTAIQAIFESTVPDVQCVHMIDDFFVMARDFKTCASHLNTLLGLCADIGIPMAPGKTTEPSTTTTFLGISLNSQNGTATLPTDKLLSYSKDITELLCHKKVKRKSMESIIGKLNFAASVVPARPFLRRMIDTLSAAPRPYHYIRLTNEVKQDLRTWLVFLTTYNGVTYFRALNITPSDSIHMASDASKHGFGAVYGRRWLQAPYPTSWQHFHITILELYPILVMVHVFGHLLRNSNILFHCDNSAVVAILNKQSSKDKTVMKLVRPLVLYLVGHNISLRSIHIPGLLNVLPDKISRFQVTPSLLLHFNMDLKATPVPEGLLPSNFAIC